MTDDLANALRTDLAPLDRLRAMLTNGTTVERRPGDPEVSKSTSGQVTTVQVLAYPEAPTERHRADVHFVLVAPTEGFPEPEDLVDAVKAALGPGEFDTVITAKEMAGGLSYITLGAWLGSQELALRLIGAVEIAGLADAITPVRSLGFEPGPLADDLAGQGLVMMGMTGRWDQ